jgi:hypothetical protein
MKQSYPCVPIGSCRKGVRHGDEKGSRDGDLPAKAWQAGRCRGLPPSLKLAPPLKLQRTRTADKMDRRKGVCETAA